MNRSSINRRLLARAAERGFVVGARVKVKLSVKHGMFDYRPEWHGPTTIRALHVYHPGDPCYCEGRKAMSMMLADECDDHDKPFVWVRTASGETVGLGDVWRLKGARS